MPPFIDLAGQKFYRLTVIERDITAITQGIKWWCTCDCGNKVSICSQTLRKRQNISCGCLHKEIATKQGYKHGNAATGKVTSEYTTWADMKDRVTNPNNRNYKNYGGRGITFCKKWSNFQAFIKDMGSKPTSTHTLERKDVNGNYDSHNCIWLTRKEQNNNKRNNRRLTYNGETRTATQWAAQFNMKTHTLYSRLRLGWSVEKSLETIVNKRNIS